MTTVATTVTALQALHAGISGVVTATTVWPASLLSAHLPLALTRPGPPPATGGLKPGQGMSIMFRYYLVDVYVKPLAQGLGVDEGYQQALVLFDRFIAAYEATKGSLVLTSTLTAMMTEWQDTGVVPSMRYGAADETLYWGFQFRVLVKADVTT